MEMAAGIIFMSKKDNNIYDPNSCSKLLSALCNAGLPKEMPIDALHKSCSVEARESGSKKKCARVTQ